MGNKIMVVDDMTDTIELMETILKTYGFEPICFTSPLAAIEVLRKGDLPDLLILDMRMPDLSGIGFCEELRKDHKFDNLKIVFFTASSDLDKSILQKYNVLGFIFKPFGIKDIIAQIKGYL